MHVLYITDLVFFFALVGLINGFLSCTHSSFFYKVHSILLLMKGLVVEIIYKANSLKSTASLKDTPIC